MTNQKALLAEIGDPFRPFIGRELSHVDCGQTIHSILFDRGYIEHTPWGEIVRTSYFFVTVNGKAVLQKDWNTVIEENDVINVNAIPLGGGGGGSNIASILITVIAVAAAAFTGGASLYVALAWGAAAGVAMYLLTSMIPTPETPSSSLGRESASPTYTISGQSNRARLLESIPVWYGRMRGYPDLAAQPYSENRGNETYLYQLFCITQGEVDIEEIRIEDSPISSFGEVEYEVIRPGGKVTLFPDNVVTATAVSSGLELLGPNQPGYSVLGPFVTSPAGTKVNFISIDLQMPNGAYNLNDQGENMGSSASFGFEYQEINDQGVPLGPMRILIQETLTYKTQTPQTISRKIEVPEGRFWVQGFRTSDASTEGRQGNRLVWTGLKGYIPSSREYGNVTMLATIFKATNNLNQSTARRINVIGTRKLPVWDPQNGWSAPVATRSPAWAIADAIMNAEYGAKQSSDRITLPEIYRLAQTWEARGDTFNAIFDKAITFWSAITQMAAVGRATPIYYAGMIDLIRDEPKSIPAQMFTPGNIIEGSFSTSYKLGTSATPDHVIVEYFDDAVWQSTEVTCILPGSTAVNPARISMMGITNRDHAWREGMYRAAVNRDQRARHKFTSDMEGLLLRFGDMIPVSHDIPAWGQSGRVKSFNATSGKIITTEPLNFTAGADKHYIAFRKADGKADGPYEIIVDPNPQEGVHSALIRGTIEQRQAIKISDGIRIPEYTQYAFGVAERQAANLVVLSAKPNQRGEVMVTCCDYVNSTHIADQGGLVPPPPPISELPGTIVGPIVPSVRFEMTTTVGEQRIVGLPARGAIYYEFEARPGNVGNWIALGTSPNPFLITHFDAGQISVRMRGVAAIPGPWATWSGTIDATTIKLPYLDAFILTPKMFAIGLEWSFAGETNTIAAYVEIWTGPSNTLASAAMLVRLPYPASSFDHTGLGHAQRMYYWARVIDTAGRAGPWFNNAVAKTQTSEASPSKLQEALQNAVSQSMLTQELMEYIDEAGGASIVVQELINELAAMRTVKTQIRGSDGKIYTAGFGVGVNNNDGVTQSEFIVAASNFYVIDPNNPNDPGKLLFAVTPQGVVMNKAFISQLFVEEIVSSISLVSQATNAAGEPLINIDMKNGKLKVIGEASNATTVLDNRGIRTYSNKNIATRVGIFDPSDLNPLP